MPPRRRPARSPKNYPVTSSVRESPRGAGAVVAARSRRARLASRLHHTNRCPHKKGEWPCCRQCWSSCWYWLSSARCRRRPTARDGVSTRAGASASSFSSSSSWPSADASRCCAPYPAHLASRSHSEYVEGKGLIELIREDLVAERIDI